MKKEYNKLVRDNIPKIIEDNGEFCLTLSLLDNEFNQALNNKLLEETKEVISAADEESLKEELADLLEVIYAKARVNKISLEEIEKTRVEKLKTKGGFYDGVFLVHTVDKKYVDKNKGCLTCVNGVCTIPCNEKIGFDEDKKPIGHDCIGFKSYYKKH